MTKIQDKQALKKSETTQESSTPEPLYTKEQLIQAKQYQAHQDILQFLLQEDGHYSRSMVDGLITKFMKGKVN